MNGNFHASTSIFVACATLDKQEGETTATNRIRRTGTLGHSRSLFRSYISGEEKKKSLVKFSNGRGAWYIVAASILVSIVQRGENESNGPNRMETRFFEIAYRKFPKDFLVPYDQTFELSIYLLERSSCASRMLRLVYGSPSKPNFISGSLNPIPRALYISLANIILVRLCLHPNIRIFAIEECGPDIRPLSPSSLALEFSSNSTAKSKSKSSNDNECNLLTIPSVYFRLQYHWSISASWKENQRNCHATLLHPERTACTWFFGSRTRLECRCIRE